VRRGLLWASALALACWALPAAAVAAEPCPPFDGAMSFQNIQGPDDPEDYCWEVNLAENQELRQINDQEAEVFYTDPEHHAFSIVAGRAHDAVGTDVPTTLLVVQPNVIVFTVHHRAGNSAAGGSPFDYPVIAGEGWEGGFISVQIQGPPDESELKAKPSPPPVEEALAPTCEVPVLQGRTLRAAKRALLRSGCALGPVRGRIHLGARIVKQYRPAYKTLPAGTAVGVKLGR
jgi:hypothetical protein